MVRKANLYIVIIYVLLVFLAYTVGIDLDLNHKLKHFYFLFSIFVCVISIDANEDVKKNLIGFQIHYLVNASPVQKVNDDAAGAGFQFEPDFLYISDTFKMGYSMEYSHSTGLADYKFFNNFLYLQYNLKLEENSLINFYWNLGVGGSYVNYRKDNTKVDGLNPAFLSEVGWQGLSFDSLVVRVSYRATLIAERRATYGNDGVQIGVLFPF